jgi:hypothetical protein
MNSEIPGWTSYKIHVPVMHKPEATDSTDIYGNVWKNWHATVAVIERAAFDKGFAVGFLIGVIGTLIISLIFMGLK